MEAKQQARPGSTASLKGLGLVDKQIALLKERYLPYEPHLLSVPTDKPYPSRNVSPYEYDGTPFDQREVRYLQYMTLISDAPRETAQAKGDWHDEIYSNSPNSAALRSSTTTPNAAREIKKPANKMSIADYKNLKEKGIKPVTKPGASDGEAKLGHSRNTSAVTLGTPMSRMSSLEGPAETKQNGGGASFNSQPTNKVDTERPTASQEPPKSLEKSRPTTNGNAEHRNNTLHTKDSNKDLQSQISRLPPMKHSLPPRPPSPARKNPDQHQHVPEPKQKRPLESGDTTHPEKRAKLEHTHSRTPSNSLPRKPEIPLSLKPSPHKSQKQLASSESRKVTPTKPINTNHTSKSSSEKPLDLPPLLSPLPADLDDGHLELKPTPNSRKSEVSKVSQPNTPSKFKVGADTIVVKKPSTLESSPLSTPPKSSAYSSPFVIPPLLSPTLPDRVEQELNRLQQKSSLNTAEARYEKARQPNAPGVARKTIIPKVGHPPKKTHSETSKPHVEGTGFGKSSLIVKLKYKKRKANDIQRILQVRPRPDRKFLELEKERISGSRQSSLKIQDEYSGEEEDEDEEAPLSKTIRLVPKLSAAPPISKKRSNESFESRSSEPPFKRAKGPESIDVSKSKAHLEPAFKSPALTNSSQKTVLSTPKKGDAMKSTAMRKVDSSDGYSRTPQATTSTPASAEKHRLNGDIRSSPELEKLKADERRFSETALRLKRKMDSLLNTKTGDRDAVPENQKKLGLLVGLECLVLYMNSWALSEKIYRKPSNLWDGGIRLWEFIDGTARPFPVISALTSQVGALFKEELHRILVEDLTRKSDPKFLETVRATSKARDKYWGVAHAGRSALKELGLPEPLGPWSTAPDTMTYIMDALERYSRREKLMWKRDGGV